MHIFFLFVVLQNILQNFFVRFVTPVTEVRSLISSSIFSLYHSIHIKRIIHPIHAIKIIGMINHNLGIKHPFKQTKGPWISKTFNGIRWKRELISLSKQSNIKPISVVFCLGSINRYLLHFLFCENALCDKGNKRL